MRRLPLVALVLSAGLSVAACDIQTSANGELSFDIAQGKATETWSRTYKLPATGRFELINVNGRVTAEPTDGAEVVLEGRKTAKGRSDEVAKENLAKLEIREEVGESTVRVESRPPRFNGMAGHDIEWTVKVPKGIVVDLRTVNGGIRLNGLSNEVHAKTTNGGVKGNLRSSTVEASSVNGGIELEFETALDASGLLELETVNGGVTVNLPVESKATIAARCVNGGVHVNGLEISAESNDNERERRRRLNGTLNGGGARINLNTTNGGIHLTGMGKKTT